ncbi:hypothetical protein QTP88_004070 [Uroleucon formosanum]
MESHRGIHRVLAVYSCVIYIRDKLPRAVRLACGSGPQRAVSDLWRSRSVSLVRLCRYAWGRRLISLGWLRQDSSASAGPAGSVLSKFVVVGWFAGCCYGWWSLGFLFFQRTFVLFLSFGGGPHELELKMIVVGQVQFVEHDSGAEDDGRLN